MIVILLKFLGNSLICKYIILITYIDNYAVNKS
jgi:hypothetical protein